MDLIFVHQPHIDPGCPFFLIDLAGDLHLFFRFRQHDHALFQPVHVIVQRLCDVLDKIDSSVGEFRDKAGGSVAFKVVAVIAAARAAGKIAALYNDDLQSPFGKKIAAGKALNTAADDHNICAFHQFSTSIIGRNSFSRPGSRPEYCHLHQTPYR